MPITDQEIKELEEKAHQVRKDIIDITGWAGGAHVGGALSVVEILVILYFKYLNIEPNNPELENRDRVVLSKGHAGVCHAAILARKGYFDFELLREFNHFKSSFGMHLDSLKVKGVDVSTGSLGHGLPISVGLALGARVQKKSWLTYCVLGDGECNEGSNWEAAMSAHHFKVTNMVTFVDRNKLMIDGPTEEIMGLEPFADKWKAFGWLVREINGHSFQEIAEAIEYARSENSAPVMIIANTVKGKGVDFMENEVKWHYGGLDTDLIEKAKQSIDRMYKG
ncbi:transketolase [candidate division NPL-UPA2 bacterium Unc8]|uniref:Transketolase n=2 Tax=Bacteria TaxID=2 RepID=A0A9E2F1F4_PSYF1|nr:Transketolase [Candidatus Psychracetigena formicireducens]MBT9147494.1 Transketolase [Bacillota bacterium]RII00403.1 MAG: transketolase [candidate division NPL-UPA2 bacterium Unc8]